MFAPSEGQRLRARLTPADRVGFVQQRQERAKLAQLQPLIGSAFDSAKEEIKGVEVNARFHK
jgi:hypothetical protein